MSELTGMWPMKGQGKGRCCHAIFWVTAGGFLLLIVVGIIANHWFVRRQEYAALTLNLIGRQRMLVQKMAREAMTLHAEGFDASEVGARLAETRDLFERTFLSFYGGGEIVVADKAVYLPPVSYPEIREQMRARFSLWREMNDTIRVILKARPTSPEAREARLALGKSSDAMLEAANSMVLAFQAHMTRETERFYRFQAGGLGVLAGTAGLLGFFLFRFFISPLRRLSGELEHANANFRCELESARRFQAKLIKDHFPQVAGVKLSMAYLPSHGPGGDFCRVLSLARGFLGIFICDVSGHGLGAALVASVVDSSLHSCLTRRGALREPPNGHPTSLLAEMAEIDPVSATDPASVLESLNSTLVPYLLEEQFATAFFAVLDLEGATLRYANAGHPRPLSSRPGEEETSILEGSGAPLGFLKDSRYQTLPAPLAGGQRLLFYTDGLIEARSHSSGEPFGLKRLSSILSRCGSAEEACKAATDEVRDFTRGHPPEDDLLLLSLDLEKVGKKKRLFQRERIAPDRAVESVLLSAGMDFLQTNGVVEERLLQEIRLSLSEALANAVEHGSRHQAGKEIVLEVVVDEEKIVLSVANQGHGFDWTSLPDPRDPENLEKERGRGIFLIRHYMDEVLFNSRGTQITMVKYRSAV